jgi:hypothetical protein
MWPDLKATARRHPDRPIRVLDVACGGGDVLLNRLPVHAALLWKFGNNGVCVQ